MHSDDVPARLLDQLSEAIDAARQSLLVHRADEFADAIERQGDLIARLLPGAATLRGDPALAPRWRHAAQQHAALAVLLAMRQAQGRERLGALGIQPSNPTYRGAGAGGGQRHLGSA